MKYIGKLYGRAGGRYFPLSETTADIDKMESERDVFAARCAVLDERLQEAANRAVVWVNQCLCDEHMPIMCKRLEEDDLRAAIVGKKEGL